MKKIFFILLSIGIFATFGTSAQELGEGVIEKNGIITLDPPTVRRPDGYALGKMVPMDAQILFTAGQVGVDKDGNYGANIEEQADLAMRNLYEVIKSAGMDSENVLKMTFYYLKREDISVIWKARNKYFGEDFRPGSTAIVVKSLAGEKILVEVEAIAAKVK